MQAVIVSIRIATYIGIAILLVALSYKVAKVWLCCQSCLCLALALQLGKNQNVACYFLSFLLDLQTDLWFTSNIAVQVCSRSQQKSQSYVHMFVRQSEGCGMCRLGMSLLDPCVLQLFLSAVPY